MPTSVEPTNVNQPDGPNQQGPEREPRREEETSSAGGSGYSTSRWVDYDTHELVDMISELEDERRWARLREGILWAILLHILILSAITWIPKYILKVPPVIDPFAAIQQRKDLKYLDLPPDILKKYQPQVAVKPVPQQRPQVDRRTLDALKKEAQSRPVPPAPQPTPQPVQPPAPPQQAKVEQPQLPIPAQPTPQSQTDAPRPQAVPARPSFQFGSQSPDDQLKSAMRGAAQNPGYNASPMPSGNGAMARHPGAGTGGVQVLSDTQGVDFNNWLIRWHHETEHTWDPLIPDEVNPPILKQGVVVIRFKVLPNGQVTDMTLEGRSGDTGLDRAAWGAIRGSSYPPLPREFHGPYLELRAVFMYNERQ